MPDGNVFLNHADSKALDRFLMHHNSDRCISCPVTGARVPIVSWRISNRLFLMPIMGVGLGVSKNHVVMLHMVSPAGGTVLLDAVAIGIVGVALIH